MYCKGASFNLIDIKTDIMNISYETCSNFGIVSNVRFIFWWSAIKVSNLFLIHNLFLFEIEVFFHFLGFSFF